MMTPHPMQDCSHTHVEKLVKTFFAAYHEGDIATLDGLFAPAPDFQWYSTPETTVRSRDRLAPHFEEATQREDVKLLSVSVMPDRSWHGGFDFSYKFKWRAQGDAWGRPRLGKGAADCQIFVWSNGDELPPRR